MHNIASTKTIPGVEAGILLGYPCPKCGRWSKPLTDLRCGCYTCLFCHSHVSPTDINLLYRYCRTFMPTRLTYNN